MAKSCEDGLLLGGTEKPKVLLSDTPPGNNWIGNLSPGGDSKAAGEIWWDPEERAKRAREEEEGRGEPMAGLGHLGIVLLLVSELVLWVKVALDWRDSHLAVNIYQVVIPLILPSITLPLLAILHSLYKGKLSYKLSLLLLVPPSPIILHVLLAFRAFSGKERASLSRSGRVCGQVQGLVMSAPLTILSISILLIATMEKDTVDFALLHRHMFSNVLLLGASTVSFCNFILTSYRYNERISGSPVALLVGFPFLCSSISYRLLGLAVLFSFYDSAWIVLCLGMLFAISCLSVQFASNFTVCGRIFRKIFGDFESGTTQNRESSVSSSLLLSIAGVLVPCGYNRDFKLGHAHGRGWRLILINWLGTIGVVCVIVSHAMSQYIPNTFTGLSSVNLNMRMPPAEISVKTGGTELEIRLPETFMSMFAGSPVKASVSTSNQQDMVIAVIAPILLALFTFPFTLLRIILLGWNCRLRRVVEEGPGDRFTPTINTRASSGRNYCTVVWSLMTMAAFTTTLSLFAGLYMFLVVNSVIEPHAVEE